MLIGSWQPPRNISDLLFLTALHDACHAFAYVSEHFPNLDLDPAISEGFVGIWKTTEELHDLTGSFYFVAQSLLLSVWFDPEKGIFGS